MRFSSLLTLLMITGAGALAMAVRLDAQTTVVPESCSAELAARIPQHTLHEVAPSWPGVGTSTGSFEVRGSVLHGRLELILGDWTKRSCGHREPTRTYRTDFSGILALESIEGHLTSNRVHGIGWDAIHRRSCPFVLDLDAAGEPRLALAPLRCPPGEVWTHITPAPRGYWVFDLAGPALRFLHDRNGDGLVEDFDETARIAFPPVEAATTPYGLAAALHRDVLPFRGFEPSYGFPGGVGGRLRARNDPLEDARSHFAVRPDGRGGCFLARDRTDYQEGRSFSWLWDGRTSISLEGPLNAGQGRVAISRRNATRLVIDLASDHEEPRPWLTLDFSSPDGDNIVDLPRPLRAGESLRLRQEPHPGEERDPFAEPRTEWLEVHEVAGYRLFGVRVKNRAADADREPLTSLECETDGITDAHIILLHDVSPEGVPRTFRPETTWLTPRRIRIELPEGLNARRHRSSANDLIPIAVDLEVRHRDHADAPGFFRARWLLRRIAGAQPRD